MSPSAISPDYYGHGSQPLGDSHPVTNGHSASNGHLPASTPVHRDGPTSRPSASLNGPWTRQSRGPSMYPHTSNNERSSSTNCPVSRPHAPERPNILYVMADQMAAPLLKMHDPASPIKTPNIDALAQSGVVFNNAYCNSPLCAPSRFSLVTGRLPSKIGGYDNASNLASDIPTYAHYLRREGYETALAGKMHFIGPDQLHGFERRLTSDIYPGDFGWTVNWDDPDERQEWYHDMASILQAGPCVRSNQLDYDEEVMYQGMSSQCPFQRVLGLWCLKALKGPIGSGLYRIRCHSQPQSLSVCDDAPSLTAL